MWRLASNIFPKILRGAPSLHFFRSIDSFRRESTVKTWLLKNARNITSNYKRSTFFRKVILVDQVREVLLLNAYHQLSL